MQSLEFVSVRRFAEVVSLSERMVWKLISRGEIPVHRIGRRTLIRCAEGFDALESLSGGSGAARPPTGAGSRSRSSAAPSPGRGR